MKCFYCGEWMSFYDSDFEGDRELFTESYVLKCPGCKAKVEVATTWTKEGEDVDN